MRTIDEILACADELGSLGELSDAVWELGKEQPLDGSDIFEQFLEWTLARDVELWPHQEEALTDLALGDHVILGTPTGSGKSMVALGMHFQALCQNQISYYTAPIKALVSEKFFDLVDIFGRDFVGMMTGDVCINPEAPVICCTAEILAQRALREGAEADIGYVAMDEFHYYGDIDRGWAWQVPLLLLTKTKFLLMSATLGDTSAIADALRERTGVDVDIVDDAPRPVPLTYHYVDTSLETTVELAIRAGNAPIYIVHFSQNDAVASAQALASYGVADKEQREAIKAACKGTSFNTAFGKILQRFLGCGVGVHHAGMLPRYRLLVEKLAQQGLLPVICGTDTLGVGINVPIHTVLLTALTKYDGRSQRRLNEREFHQIAGRAGRAGFDTEGVVIAQAPEHEIENARARAKAAGDPKKLKKVKLKQPEAGRVTWSKQVFDKLVETDPRPLKPRMAITHSMVLALVARGGDAQQRIADLIAESAQTPEEKLALRQRADEILTTLLATGVVQIELLPDGTRNFSTTVDLPDDFALDQPLSPFLIAALEMLEPPAEGAPSASSAVAAESTSFASASLEPIREAPVSAPEAEIQISEEGVSSDRLNAAEDSEEILSAAPAVDPEAEALSRQKYELDLISLVESTLDSPRQILRVQEKRARDKAMAQMKADGLEYDERMERLEEVTYPKPLEEELNQEFAQYCLTVPWANDYELEPKSVLREMVETGDTFKSYIASYGLAKSEGTLLRYLTDAYRTLDRTIPLSKRTERLEDIIAWLGVLVRSVDSSLFAEWEGSVQLDFDEAPPELADVVVTDRRGMRVLVRNALFARVKLAALQRADKLGELDLDWGFGERKWRQALEDFYAQHDEVLIDADARSAEYLIIDESPEKATHTWKVTQIFHDSDGDHDFRIVGTVDLDATQDGGEVAFADYAVGFAEDLRE